MGRFLSFFQKVRNKAAPDLESYSRGKFLRDLAAGLTVGIVALPLSLALAIATGVPPILGLYTAGIAGFIAAIFAGSPYSVSGPAAAMVPILAAIIQKHGLEQLPYITIMAGLLLFGFALLGIGKFIRKVPESVIIGFTAGVAIVIFCGQLNTFLGLSGLEHHESFLGKLGETFSHLGTASIAALVIGLIALALIIWLPRLKWLAKFPVSLIAVVVAVLLTLLVPVFANVATLSSAYGDLPMGFPGFNSFNFSPEGMLHGNLWIAAFQIAGLIAIESLLCAVVADKLTKGFHRSNQELMAQGAANLGSAFFGGIPATAVIARTGTIIKSGAQSRIASLIHAIVIIGFIVALAPLAAYIPLPALSAVLFVTAFKIGEFKEAAHFVREKSWQLGSVLLVTMILTVMEDLVMGVAAGLLLHLAFATHGWLRGRNSQEKTPVFQEIEK